MEHLTYHEILAEQYEENAKKVLVQQQDYEDEDVDAYDADSYEENELADKELFNRFQPRHTEDNIMKAPKAEHDPLRHKIKSRTRVLNIDGKFRGSVNPNTPVTGTCSGNTILTPDIGETAGTSSSYFLFMPSRVFKNVTSIKLSSFEFPNVFYTFSAVRGNTMFMVNTKLVTIPDDGNYSITDLVSIINPQIVSESVVMSYSSNTNKVKFSGTAFSLTFPPSTSNPNGNGIGYNLGFSGLQYPSTVLRVSEQMIDVIQDSYVYLAINDYNLVEHQEYGQTHFDAFAKITLMNAKGTMVYDNSYLNSTTKEYHFPQPVNISRFEIKVLDAYGQVLDLQGSNFSLTLELQEVIDSGLYEKMREL